MNTLDKYIYLLFFALACVAMGYAWAWFAFNPLTGG